MTKTQIKKELAYEYSELKKAKEFMERTEGHDGPSCSGSVSIGWHEGRIALFESLLKEKTK